MSHRGSVLLEVLVAVAILVGSGTVIMAASDQGERMLASARERSQAADLARSAIAAIEAGLATPQSLAGSVRSRPNGAAWLVLDADNKLPETPEDESRWTLNVEVEPADWPGLSRVTAAVSDRRRGEDAGAVFVLTQLVRLTPLGEDRAGESMAPSGGSRPAARGRTP